MTTVTSLKTSCRPATDERQLRVDLAAAFRLIACANWHEAVANHLSLAVSADGKTFFMNPRWKHFSRVKASDLLLLNVDDKSTMNRPDAPDLTAWCLHGRLHAALPQARCVMHVHPPYGTAIATLTDPEIKPIEQNTARYYNRVAYDMSYGGMASSDEEGDRLAALLGNRSVMLMGNHGVLVCGSSVADAYDRLYYLERACQTLVLAYQTGKPLHVMSHAVAEKTAQEWEADSEQYLAHFEEMKKILGENDPSYAE